jgi:16S rRNA (guanine527-N7)-methyltransferase
MENHLIVSKLPILEETWLKSLNWTPNEQQITQFQALYERIIEKNQQLNLTRLTEPLEFWEKHLWDSLSGLINLSVADLKEEILKAIDIGTGAGFPGIPIAIVFPKWQVTLLDSTNKKVTFLTEIKQQMQLQNIQPLTERVENLGQDLLHREQYDLVFIRAVAEASVCAEYTLPLLKKGGKAVLYKGQWTQEETKKLSEVSGQLGGKIDSIYSLITPISQGIRNCIYLKKVNNTPCQYPRPVGVPVQYPL